MIVPTKEGDVEIPQDWIDLWNTSYYDVPRAIHEAIIWSHDNPQRQKTKRGVRAFLGRWIRKACVRRPVPQDGGRVVQEPGSEVRQLSLESRRTHLAKLRELVK